MLFFEYLDLALNSEKALWNSYYWLGLSKIDWLINIQLSDLVFSQRILWPIIQKESN